MKNNFNQTPKSWQTFKTACFIMPSTIPLFIRLFRLSHVLDR